MVHMFSGACVDVHIKVPVVVAFLFAHGALVSRVTEQVTPKIVIQTCQ